MLTTAQYYQKIINFVNSLVFKFDEIRIHQNYHTYVKYGLTPPTKYNSKYYQDITVNTKLDFNIMFNGKILSRENLLVNLSDRADLIKYDNKFNHLISMYPGYSDYIRGCLLDISMDDFIAMENHTLISYDKTFLGDNEIGLLIDIENYVKMYMENYNNRMYMADELYLPAILGNLYNLLVLFIVNEKFKNVMTNSADTYHVSNKLSSYKNMSEYTGNFDVITNIWLYGNVDRLKRNIGKQKTLTEVLTKVLEHNGQGVANLVKKPLYPKLLTDNIQNINKEFYKYQFDLKPEASNAAAYKVLSKKYDVSNVTRLINSNGLGRNNTAFENTLTEKKLDVISNDQLTSLFILDNPEKITTVNTNNFVYTISNIINVIRNENLAFYIDFVNPVTSKIHKISINDIEKILVLILHRIFKIETNKFSINFHGIFNRQMTEAEVIKTTLYKKEIIPIYKYITSIYGLHIPMVDTQSLTVFLTAARNIDSRIWFVMSNILDSLAKSDIMLISDKLINDDTVTYDIQELKSTMTNDVISDIVNIDDISIINGLLKTVSGVTIDESQLLIDKLTKTKKFFNTLTSYTVDLLIETKFTDKHSVLDSTSGIALGYKPLAEIKEIKHILYEELDFYIKDVTFNTNTRVYSNLYIPSLSENSNGLPCLIKQVLHEPTVESYSKLLNGKPYKIKQKFLGQFDNIDFVIGKIALPKVNITKQVKPEVIHDKVLYTAGYVTANEYIRLHGLPYKANQLKYYVSNEKVNVLPEYQITPRILSTIPKAVLFSDDLHKGIASSSVEAINSNNPEVTTEYINNSESTVNVETEEIIDTQVVETIIDVTPSVSYLIEE